MLFVVALAFGGWTALARTANPTSTPLPGSQFQGGDGDQDNDTAHGWIDWQALQLDGKVGHKSDPNANDNVFVGGDKEDSPDGWGLTTQTGGSTPAEGNILDFYRAVDKPGGGDVFLYLAFTRDASSGTVFLTFELNQDARLWRNSTGASIPCRTTGDILISFGEHGNGPELAVERWVTDTKQAPPGVCARTGHLVQDTQLASDDSQASFNNGSSPITNFLQGAYGTTIPQQRFGETAINLSKVLADLGDRCAVFGSAWMHSRSSLSENSQMQDYVGPEPFNVATCKASPAITSSASGAVKRKARGKHRLRRHRSLRSSPEIFDTATLSGGNNPTGTITFRLFGPDNGDCSGSPVFQSTATVVGNGNYQSGSFSPTAAGIYRWVVEYSGDANNNGAGPTACGKDTETVVVSKAAPTLSSTASGPVQLQPGRRPARRRHHRVRRRLHSATAPQEIYDTADLEGARSPTGTLIFRLYGPDNPGCSGDGVFTSAVPVSANGPHNSAPFTPTAAGTYRWRVSYSGDANNDPAGPTECGIDSETVVVSPAKPTVVTVASAAVSLGGSITDSATLSGGARPTGKIEFKLYGPNNGTCSGGAADSSTVDVSGNGTYHSNAFKPTATGIYRWVATYSGDGNNDPAATSCGDRGEAVVVSPGPPPPPPSLTTIASPGAPAGTPVHDTAVLSGGADPTGTITFRVYGPDDAACMHEPAAVSSVEVSHGNGSYVSAVFTPTVAGTYRWVAGYSGDEDNGSVETHCNDANESVVVSRALPAIRTLALRAVPIGHAVGDAARLTGASDPHGLIVFRLYGPDDDTCSQPPAFTVVQRVIGNGLYRSPKVTPQRAGTYRWVASYTGDRNNAPAATACGDSGETAAVLPRRPALSTSASPPANVRRKTVRVQAAGRSIYDAAILTRGFAPTGEITFALYGPGDRTCSGTPLLETSATVTGNGIYNSEAYTPVASGTYRWVATYSGDSNNRAAGPTSCGDRAERVRVTIPADPALTTSASEAVTIGGAVHDTAHLSSGARPTGTITFRLYGPNDSGCTGDPVFASTVGVAGNGDYDSKEFVPTRPGAYRWVAEYSGDRRNRAAGPTACDDAAEVAIVRPATIAPVVPALSTTTSTSPGVGVPISDVAHLLGGLAPTGAITFSLYGPGDLTCSVAPVFTSTVAVNGNGDYVSAPYIAPAPGSYRWVITYSGDAMNAGAGPTTCGDGAETAAVSATPDPQPEHGPNVPPPTRPKQKPKHRVKPPPPPPQPIVTG
jgi:hypothetical protein